MNSRLLQKYMTVLWLCLSMAASNIGATEPTLLQAAGRDSDQDSDSIAAHESNGPEGTEGIPMQRLKGAQIGLVLLILAISSSLAISAQNHAREKQKVDE